VDGVGVAVSLYRERSVLRWAGSGGGAGCEFGGFNIGRGGEFGWLDKRGV